MATRRGFLTLAACWWSTAVARAHEHAAEAPPEQASRGFVFFTPEEAETLRRLAAILIPADERSGGAAAAKVEEYVDFVLAHGGAALKKSWRAGLKRFRKYDEARLRKVSANEFAARSADERFFVLLKDAVVEGFYTSREGIVNELGYRGYTFLREFPAADMSLVKVPAGYFPRLRERS
jgi:hypothetical protein